jgi:catechol 2,3-dioxygenase
VRLEVASLSRSVDWYSRVLGLTRVQGGGEVELLGVAGEEPLLELRQLPGARPHPPRGRLGLFHFAILLPSRPALGTLLVHLARVGVPLGASDHGVSEALYLQDPDGLGVEVYADRPRELWSYRDGRLEMGTLPLDSTSVQAASAGAPWEGLPAGTRMGHLHLHVGSLPEAESFYSSLLGLTPTVRGYPGALFLSAGGYHHHLGLNTWAGPGALPATRGDARLLDWELVLGGQGAVEEAANRFRKGGHLVEVDEGGGVRVEDPWRTGLRLKAVEGGS